MGDGIGVDHANMMLSLTKLVIKNQANPILKEYTKVWLHEANEIKDGFNPIISGLLQIVKGSGAEFKGQARLLNKLDKKLADVPSEKTEALAGYYRNLLKLN